MSQDVSILHAWPVPHNHCQVPVWQLSTLCLCRVPLYYEGKLLFVLWLWQSSSNGAGTLYSRMVSPLLKQHEGTIDQSLGEAHALVFDYVAEAMRWYVMLLVGPCSACELSFRQEDRRAACRVSCCIVLVISIFNQHKRSCCMGWVDTS